ncbi:MAG: alcohol dehydrogenase catalytic domain-containing protein [Deltaproteobacteria bacterium]|nr:alcohol dehydrogenase catalytic domain-containing protein [Deltaproteobacteria bacterium]
MKQVLLRDINMLDVVKTDRPGLPPGGVLVAMRAAALCRTDVKMIRQGHRDLVLPRIPGHEGVGEVIASDAPALPPGTMAAVYPGRYCGTCPACRQGQTARCRSLSIFGFNRDGLFRTLVPFSGEELSSLVPCPPEMDPLVAVLAEPLACCLSALRKFPGVERDTALVVGAGAVGCLFAALLVSSGWQRVLIADSDPARLGGEIPPGVEKLPATTMELPKIFQRMGLTAALQLLIPACPGGLDWPFWEALAPRGCVSVFSGLDGAGIREVAMNRLHYGELVLAGSYGCNRIDFADALGMLSRQVVDVSFLRPVTISLENVLDGVGLLEKRRAKKVIINRFE